jgi:AmmeMemoRadiSam system protein B
MELSGVRVPAVAGRFYSSDPVALARELESCLGERAAQPLDVLGVLVPHAGYVYSGAICGRALSAIVVPERVLLVHTKHCAGGGALSLSRHRGWQTPLGEVPADVELTTELARLSSVTASDEPHAREHAAEVVLPFLLSLQPALRVSVLSVGAQGFSAIERAAGQIASVLAQREPVLIVASSDMNHYEDHETTLQKDRRALAALERFDAEGLLLVCEREAITMCGMHATALMLRVCALRGGSKVSLLGHATSAESSGDYSHTVGYASAWIA